MILKGSQRGGAKQQADHLLKTEENEHVEVYELRGFTAKSLKGALQEIYAVSKGTRCRQFMFSLSLNPPQTETVSHKDFKEAIRAVEQKLGLTGQPRATVFHEKEGRRHAHVVWSRIDIQQMKAINMSRFKIKLREVSRELFIKHGWRMPEGLVDSQQRDPTNFTRAEWQQAKRAGQYPKALKAMFQECWAISDSRKAFAKALEERGYYLARGDRRGFVAVDFRGEVYAISKWTRLRTKEVKAKLGDPKDLPSLDQTKALITALMTNLIQGFVKDAEAGFKKSTAELSFKKTQLTQRHRLERARLKERQDARWTQETNRRAARLQRGLRGLWDRLTGKYRKLRRQNEIEAYEAFKRDQREKETLISRQLDERQTLQREIAFVRQRHAAEIGQLHRDVAHYMQMNAQRPLELKEHFRQADRQEKKSKDRSRGRRRSRTLKPDN